MYYMELMEFNTQNYEASVITVEQNPTVVLFVS
jgi:hypothetical protein